MLYLIPGLGLDCRIFKNLDFGAHDTMELDWIEPLNLSEDIRSYARRMAESIPTGKDSVLIGHSFGGIIAQEIAQTSKIRKIILISSIKSRKENTLSLKMIAPLKLYNTFNKKLIVQTFPYWKKWYGYKTKEQQELFLDMVNQNSDTYLQWALASISRWQGVEKSNTPIIHLHGDKDMTFPIRAINNITEIVKGGDHYMIFRKPKTISKLVHKHLIQH